jgi:hypothetical protein
MPSKAVVRRAGDKGFIISQFLSSCASVCESATTVTLCDFPPVKTSRTLPLTFVSAPVDAWPFQLTLTQFDVFREKAAEGRRTLQDASAYAGDLRTARSVMECASPLALSRRQ